MTVKVGVLCTGGGSHDAVKTVLFTCRCKIPILQPMIQFLITGRFME